MAEYVIRRINGQKIPEVERALVVLKDMRVNEVLAFAPLILWALFMGIYPSFFIEPMEASVENLLSQIGATGASLALR